MPLCCSRKHAAWALCAGVLVPLLQGTGTHSHKAQAAFLRQLPKNAGFPKTLSSSQRRYFST
jgi:hypothetical protein